MPQLVLQKQKPGRVNFFARLAFVVLLAALSSLPRDTLAQTGTILSKPFLDVIELCSHPTGSRQLVARQLANRGWERISEIYPDWLPKLLADGELISVFLVPQLNFSGVDIKTAEIPNMDHTFTAIQKSASKGIHNYLWLNGEKKAFLWLKGGDPNDPQRGNLKCWLYSDSRTDVESLIEAFSNSSPSPREKRVGPASALSYEAHGCNLQEPFCEHPGLFPPLKEGVMPQTWEPKIGAGRSRIELWHFNADDFFRRYGRYPNAYSLFMINRINSDEEL